MVGLIESLVESLIENILSRVLKFEERVCCVFISLLSIGRHRPIFRPVIYFIVCLLICCVA